MYHDPAETATGDMDTLMGYIEEANRQLLRGSANLAQATFGSWAICPGRAIGNGKYANHYHE